jgi:hypothetical protein
VSAAVNNSGYSFGQRGWCATEKPQPLRSTLPAALGIIAAGNQALAANDVVKKWDSLRGDPEFEKLVASQGLKN